MKTLLTVAAIFSACCSFASPGDMYLLNASSDPMTFPVRISEKLLIKTDLPSSFTQKDGSVVTVEKMDGHTFIHGAPAPFSALPVSTDRASKASLMPVNTTEIGIEIDTDAGKVIFQPQGRLSLESRGKIVSLAVPANDINVTHHGALSVILTALSKSGSVHYIVYHNGAVQVEGLKTLRSIDPDQVFLYRQARRKEIGIALATQGNDLTYPEDWWGIFATPSEPLIAVFPMYDSICKGQDGLFELKNEGSYIIAPVSSIADIWTKRIQTHASCLLVENEQGSFTGSVFMNDETSFSVEVMDRNNNSLPDTQGDIWKTGSSGQKALVMAFSKSPENDAGTRLSVFKMDANASVDSAQLEEVPARAQAGDTAGLAALGAMDKKQSSDNLIQDNLNKIKAEFFIEDWNRDGILFRGSLFAGGFLASDRFSKNASDWSKAWDLDGNGFCDVFENIVTDFYFNFLHQVVSVFGIHLDPNTAGASLKKGWGYEYQHYSSQFKKTCNPGRFYEGAAQGFEEHFFVDIKPGEFTDTFSNGAAFFYYANGGGDVNRMTMGRLDGSDRLRDWDIELNPDPANEEIVDWVVKTWKDPWGHELKLNTISVPDKWDGSLADESQYLQGWYDMATNRYETKALQATFSPPGSVNGSSEGMYGGHLTTQERIEIDEDGATYELYYSPLMGGLHLKGADFGTYAIPSKTPDFFLDIYRYHHREAHLGDYRFPGTQPGIRWEQREAKRLEGPVFLTYFDQNKDGYFDTYLYDQDNDGMYEKRLSYSENEHYLTFTHGDMTAVWPQTLKFEEAFYLPENYDSIGELYRKGTHIPPMVIASSIGSAGIPMTTQVDPFFKEIIPKFFFSFGSEWESRVAANATHDSPLRNPWTDFNPEGLSRLGTMFTLNGMAQTTLHGEWSSSSLADIDVLVVSELAMTPSSAEISALKDWVSAGGTVLFACQADEVQRMRFNAVGKELGFSFEEELVDKQAPIYRWASLGPINNPKTRAAIHRRPAPWNEITNFAAPQTRDLLDGLKYASFVGYPLTATSSEFVPALTYGDHVLLAQADIGDGHILVSGAELFNNRYIWHHEFFEDGVDNDVLVERIIESVCNEQPVLRIRALDVTPERSMIEFSGKGGNLFFSRRYDPRATDLGRIGVSIDLPPQYDLGPVQLNGRQVPREEAGVLHLIEVPPGQHSVEIDYITKPQE